MTQVKLHDDTARLDEALREATRLSCGCVRRRAAS